MLKDVLGEIYFTNDFPSLLEPKFPQTILYLQFLINILWLCLHATGVPRGVGTTRTSWG